MIGAGAFLSSSVLNSVIIPVSVVFIGDNAFPGYVGNVFYAGSEEQWGQITILSGNESLTSATILCNSPSPFSLGGRSVLSEVSILSDSTLPPVRTASPVSIVPHPFTDVAADAWYNEAVQSVYDKGLMNGTGNGVFSPDAVTSRAMVVTILYRMEGCPTVTAGASFTDVPGGQWYSDAVAWAGTNEIVNGYGNGSFGPNAPVTREQLAVILYRYAAYKQYDTTVRGDASAFLDGGAVSAYAAEAVNWAIGTGLLQGSGMRLTPAGNATRAQVATVLMRFCRDISHFYAITLVSALDAMCEPSGILFLDDGAFLVTDTYNHVIWQVLDGARTVYAGGDTVTDPFDRPLGGYNDAGLGNSYFRTPWAIAPFLDGYAVSDADNNAVRLVRAETIQTVNGSTTEKLTVTDMGVVFHHPTGLAADEAGNLYVSDTYEGAVRKITPEGSVTTFAGGLADPLGLCWKDGALYIAETGANRIVKIADGRTVVAAGSGEDGFIDGPAAQAAFSAPQCVAVGDDGAIYVSDTANSAIRKIHDGVVTTMVRRDESDLDAVIPVSPVGLMLHGGQLYVCDSFARKVFVISREQ